jgi:hypothetical protein
MTFLSVMAQNGGVLKISDTVLAKKKHVEKALL